MAETIDTLNQQSEEEVSHEEGQEWLSFRLADLDYAVDILRVKEIRIWEEATRIPYSPSYVVGLINLRGAIVPVVDLRSRIGLPAIERDHETVILILDVEAQGVTKSVGLVVDRISEVVTATPRNTQVAPRFDLVVDERFVAGITDIDSRMIILLDVDTLLELEVTPVGFEKGQENG